MSIAFTFSVNIVLTLSKDRLLNKFPILLLVNSVNRSECGIDLDTSWQNSKFPKN